MWQQLPERGLMELEQVKQYIRVDYDDDDTIIQMMIDAVLDEMEELIPTFDRTAPTNRQKLLICAYTKELYDKRENMTEKNETMRYAIRSLMLKEMLR